MEDENEESIDTRFKILEKIGCGGTAVVFKVKDLNTEQECAAKVLREKDCVYYDKEINILNELKESKNPNITNIITSGEGPINRKKLKNVVKKYFVLEYMPKGELIDYLDFPNQGLCELYSKFIFSQILNGVKSCHKLGICHRDIKLENILVTDKFSPKLCDFGFATHNAPNLSEYIGTLDHCAPEILLNKPYDGFKADIFSLGVVLILLATNKQCFRSSSPTDSNYRFIVAGKLDKFWGRVDTQINKLSKELKDLFIKMVSFKPNERPTIDEILKSDWMKEINDMNNEQLKILEDNVITEFERRESIVEKEKKVEIKAKENEDSDDFTRGIEDEENIFRLIEPKELPQGKKLDNYIRLKGYINASKFMYDLYQKLYDKYDNCVINHSEKELKFDITFNEKDEDKEEELPEEMKEEFKKLGIYDENKIKKGKDNLKGRDTTILVKLYSVKNEEYDFVLSFKKKRGTRINYLEKIKKISDLVKEIMS